MKGLECQAQGFTVTLSLNGAVADSGPLLGEPVGYGLLRCTKRTEKPGREPQPPACREQRGLSLNHPLYLPLL